jgi:hypothetical protein
MLEKGSDLGQRKKSDFEFELSSDSEKEQPNKKRSQPKPKKQVQDPSEDELHNTQESIMEFQ